MHVPVPQECRQRMTFKLVRWQTAITTLDCAECTDRMYPGESYATYKGGDGIRQTYCRSCGKELEDSLTTTEDVK